MIIYYIDLNLPFYYNGSISIVAIHRYTVVDLITLHCSVN